ncbi:hypothetical protein GSI_11703 [Ganoderma sinense ZZ0214-1]|uniref:HAT C-terminal dimerisation domain-containing protein n=1 Tax=Ganoderma sinense ZZ0214-1 TaxID=1077348 RepID=A0A2G8RWQ5_9APHY|nr:hypothetical protein GSI_11703 [Ganoderma sinense ZZ0214-1]
MATGTRSKTKRGQGDQSASERLRATDSDVEEKHLKKQTKKAEQKGKAKRKDMPSELDSDSDSGTSSSEEEELGVDEAASNDERASRRAGTGARKDVPKKVKKRKRKAEGKAKSGMVEEGGDVNEGTGARDNVIEKKEMTQDLRIIFIDVTTRKVKVNGRRRPMLGHWCTICQWERLTTAETISDDPKVIKSKGKSEAGWYKGGNSSDCRHIASAHYELYSQKCKELGLEEQKEAVPKDIWAAWEAKNEAAEGKKGAQTMLDTVVKMVKRPQEFTPEALLQSITVLIVTGNHAMALANEVAFRNVLITMRPTTRSSELPIRSLVRTKITNEFVDFLNGLRDNISCAPGAVSIAWDSWTAPHISDPFLDMLALWIQVNDGVWSMRDEVGVFHKIFGSHTGVNLSRYLLLFLDRIAVTLKSHNKLGHMTNDNASNNGTGAEVIAARLARQGVLGTWNKTEAQLGCLRHIIQLGIEDFMGVVTKKAAAETKQAIWDYDPRLEENSVMHGVLDVIAVILTLAVKASDHSSSPSFLSMHWSGHWSPVVRCSSRSLGFHGITRPGPGCQTNSPVERELCRILPASRAHTIQASGTHKQEFQRLQLANLADGQTKALVIPLHNNMHWGSALKMLSWMHYLQVPVNLFVESADHLFGPITKVRHQGEATVSIPWHAFEIKSEGWKRVALCIKILTVIPVLETLCSKWEKRLEDPDFEIFHDAIRLGLEKLNKYYKRLNNTDAYILAMLLHPYYKLNYIEEQWGGAEEYTADLEAGDPHARDCQKYARDVVDKAVHNNAFMTLYWPKRLGQVPGKGNQQVDKPVAGPSKSNSLLSDDEDNYDRARWERLQKSQSADGWKTKLVQYLTNPCLDVSKYEDTVNWWQRHATVYPTLARIALDILPIAAASVGVESLFSRAKHVATDHRASLDPDIFEQIECLHYYWKRNMVDFAQLNEEDSEEIDVAEFADLESQEELLAEMSDDDSV